MLPPSALLGPTHLVFSMPPLQYSLMAIIPREFAYETALLLKV